MTDLGFGVVDRRSVLVLLFSLGLSTLLLGNPIPIDTTNLLTAFLGLLLLSGFVYSARSLVRLSLAVVHTVLLLLSGVVLSLRSSPKKALGLRGVLIGFAQTIHASVSWGFITPLFELREWKFEYHYGSSLYPTPVRFPTLGVMGFLDRALLVGIAIVATLPQYAAIVKSVGFVGIAALIVLYVVTGKFSFVLEDAMYKTEMEALRQHQEQVQAAKNPDVKFPPTIRTEPVRDYGP